MPPVEGLTFFYSIKTTAKERVPEIGKTVLQLTVYVRTGRALSLPHKT